MHRAPPRSTFIVNHLIFSRPPIRAPVFSDTATPHHHHRANTPLRDHRPQGGGPSRGETFLPCVPSFVCRESEPSAFLAAERSSASSAAPSLLPAAESYWGNRNATTACTGSR